MTLDEQALLTAIRFLGLLWSAVLIFVGFMTIHQFSFSKNVLSIFITAAGIAVIIFLAILFVGLLQQVIVFIKSVCSEIITMT